MYSCKPNVNLKTLIVFLLALFTSTGLFAQDQASAPANAADAEPAVSAEGPDQALIDAGQTLFKSNCAACHTVTSEVVVGPGLKDVHKRRSDAWLRSWIKNSQQLIQSGDKDAVAIFNEYNKQQMPSFAFSDEELDAVIAYMAHESAAAVAPTAPTGGNVETAAGENVGTDAIGTIGSYLDIVLIVLIVVLIVMVITLLLITSVLKSYLNKKELDSHDSELVNQRFDLSSIYKSKAVRVVAGLILLIVVLDASIEGVMGIGIQEGYAPKQPIAFSHKLHAGEHQIDCGYCHSTVYESRSASIPSANICMNCHSQIKKESPEIQKIYKAIERNRPIEWVRIHNLPDLAYFNHSQHTNVAGVECQTCHGPIETMEVVSQYSPLTMGWCIDCHRQTPLNTEGNGYYDKLVQMHENESKEAFTVASNGGTECSKCHY